MARQSADGGEEVVQDESTISFPKWRGGIIALALCAFFSGVMLRACDLQINQSAALSEEAVSQLTGSVEIRARRGAIYDRNGRELAISVLAESVCARPPQISSPRDVAAVLAPVLEQSELTIFGQLTHDSSFRWLERRVSPYVAEEVRSLGLPGIETMNEWQRFYPMRARAGHLLGFIGDDGYGLEGLEMSQDHILVGETMEIESLRDVHGRSILYQEAPELRELEGTSIVLSIDTQIQRIVERELERVIEEQEAQTGVIVVMDPSTGEILAMTNWPPFDPNQFRILNPSDWRNRAVTDAWEPGSTMKVFTYAAALEAGVVDPDDDLDTAGGRLTVGRYRIHDHHRADSLEAWEVIQYSSNIGAYRMAQRLGDENLYQAFIDFGFGNSTGLGLGGEQSGILETPPWAEIELANRAFGQGLSATPLQLALGFSAIANGGELMEPMLILEVRDKDGNVVEQFQPQVRRRVISEETAALVREAMETVTHEGGTGTNAAIMGIRVAGKTGTAQKVNPETGAYDDIWMVSFIGFLPVEDPIFTIVVMVDEPQHGEFGSDVAAPVFARVAEQALATRGIFVSDSTEDDEEASLGLDTVNIVDESTTGPEPPTFDAVAPNGRVAVPDLQGMPIVDVLVALNELDLDGEIHQWGLVSDQWPTPGASVLPGSTIDVYMTSPYRLEDADLETGGP